MFDDGKLTLKDYLMLAIAIIFALVTFFFVTTKNNLSAKLARAEGNLTKIGVIIEKNIKQHKMYFVVAPAIKNDIDQVSRIARQVPGPKGLRN
ncbi:MAG: hypothetical protein V2A72_06980 [Candidatus Omnitrophota bacterium]